MRRLRILTWHVHGSYLYSLCSLPHQIIVPFNPDRNEGYVGRTPSYPWPRNLEEIPADRVRKEKFDCILFQSRNNYVADQYEILTPEQRKLPRIYLEHDPPRESPTDTRHPVDDPNVLLVHVTHFNALMWDSGPVPTCVIEHGVHDPGPLYTGERERGIVVVNNIRRRGRRLGLDILQGAHAQLPLDLVGMGWQEVRELGGIGEIPFAELPAFAARYRFFFSPIRYTSLGMAICEAMMTGIPVVGLATTELTTVVQDGVSGFVHTDPGRLIERMKDLLRDPIEAKLLGEGARKKALERFNIYRFREDWNAALSQVAGRGFSKFLKRHPLPTSFSLQEGYHE